MAGLEVVFLQWFNDVRHRAATQARLPELFKELFKAFVLRRPLIDAV